MGKKDPDERGFHVPGTELLNLDMDKGKDAVWQFPAIAEKVYNALIHCMAGFQGFTVPLQLPLQ